VIGEIIQHILDKDFYVEYSYSDTREDVHSFKVWRLYRGNLVVVSFAMSVEVQYAHKDILIMEADRYLAQVIDAITQRRLIESRDETLEKITRDAQRVMGDKPAVQIASELLSHYSLLDEPLLMDDETVRRLGGTISEGK
jgi:hypothetical protein